MLVTHFRPNIFVGCPPLPRNISCFQVLFLTDPCFDEEVKGVEDSSRKNDSQVCLPHNATSILLLIFVNADATNTNCTACVITTFGLTNNAGDTAMDVLNISVSLSISQIV